MRPALAVPLLTLALAAAPAVPAPPPAEAAPRPRVALVLSGGGALGLAHVGVLQVLEELRVPVDCVAGTSMGAIVGGLYAAGYSPSELEQIATTLDWAGLIRDAPDRRRLPYRRKVDDLIYLTRWEMGLSRRGLRLPTGLVAGHRLGVELQLLTLRTAGIDDFDRLPLPFRAVASDTASGETVVLDRGDLASALRASMAVPGLFSPVERDGRLLADGGVVANLPVAAAREMGAEVVIAVDLGAPLAERPRPDSLPGVLAQSLGTLTRREVERALAGADVVIRPRVGEWRLLDFQAAAELIPRGAEAARAALEPLAALAVDEAAWGRHLDRQRRAPPAMVVRQVAVEPGPGLPHAAVARAIETRPGRPLDPVRLAADLDRLWDLGEFETVDFSLAPAGDGTWDLSIVGHRKRWGPNYLRTGLSLASDLEGTSSFSLLGAVTFTGQGRLGREVKVSAQAGERPILVTEVYQPLSGSRVPFAALGLQAGEAKERVEIGESQVQYRFLEVRAAFDLGLALGRYGEVRAGLRHLRTRGWPFGERPAEVPRFDRDHSGLGGQVVFDQLDRVNFPRRGLLAVAEYHEAREELGADEEYRRLTLQSVAAATAGRHTFAAILRAQSALGGELPPSEWIGLGGLFNLSGQPPGEIAGAYGGTAAMLYLYRFGRLPKFGDGIYAGLSLEAGNAWGRAHDVDSGDLRHAVALVVGADTLLGPVYVGHGRASGGSDAFFLFLGRTF